MRVLVVDDDESILDTLRRGLQLEGLDVLTARDGTAALRAAEDGAVDAIVLDVGLPDLNGRAVAARMRAAGAATPILMLSALDQIDDRIAGLESGADDYLVKPFAIDELVARLRALMRRAAGHAAAQSGAIAPVRVGALLVDPGGHRASWDGRDLGLTRRELDLLHALARNPGVVMSRDRLLELVWGYDFKIETKVVDVFVSYVRRKLADAGAPKIIETVRGVGFILQRA